MNHKGNAFVLALSILQIVLLISINLSINISHLKDIKTFDSSLEIIRIKAIQRIKKEFYKQNCTDFIIEENGYVVEGYYEENKCHLYFYGKQDLEMIVNYDDVYLCISSIEYIYD